MKDDCTTCNYSKEAEGGKVTCSEFPKKKEFRPECCGNYCPDPLKKLYVEECTEVMLGGSMEHCDSYLTESIFEMIDLDEIKPHPDNPRKDIGDVTELAESIKANGILQNLTVVPWFSSITKQGCDDPEQQKEMGYIAVIGHRRLAAAKLAGLKKVPCVVSDMDYKTQIATMLTENMQRSDLTAYEQAEGFQMMMDLGETVQTISEKTGFSETTVRRRAKLLELDKEKFKKSVDNGATLMDLMELEKIQDPELKNSVLEKFGTPNYKWELQSAIDKEKRKNAEAAFLERLKTFATEVTDSSDLIISRSYAYYNYDTFVIPEDAGTVKYFYKSEYGGLFYLYKEKDKTVTVDIEFESKKAAEKERSENLQAAEKERSENLQALREISQRAYRMRYDFVKNISAAAAKKLGLCVIETFLTAMIRDDFYYNLDPADIATFLGITVPENDEDEDDEIFVNTVTEAIKQKLELGFLAVIYLSLDSQRENYYQSWNGNYRENKSLDMVYDFLEKLGYSMSDEEKSLRNGTHELFCRQI